MGGVKTQKLHNNEQCGQELNGKMRLSQELVRMRLFELNFCNLHLNLLGATYELFI